MMTTAEWITEARNTSHPHINNMLVGAWARGEMTEDEMFATWAAIKAAMPSDWIIDGCDVFD